MAAGFWTILISIPLLALSIYGIVRMIQALIRSDRRK
jgi:hypothetical protein